VSVHFPYMPVDARRAQALQRLPLPYATALRLRDAGMADKEIAERVGVDLDALATFMRVAEAKLAAAAMQPPT
jgi:DNA-directed RNA polymerase specialized sigma24 family protein